MGRWQLKLILAWLKRCSLRILIILLLISYQLLEAFANSEGISDNMGCIRQKWQEKPKGFLWYNEQLVQKIKESQYSDLKLLLKESPEPHDRRIESLKQKFNRAQRKALDNPTLENVIKAQRLQKQIMEKSQKFAAMWQLASLMDYKLTNSFEPANSLHKKLYQTRVEQENFQKLQNLSKDWGLILQVNNSCSYCHAFVPIVQNFADKYGFQLLLVANNGEDFQGRKTSKDTGLLQRLNPKQIVPVLYLLAGNGKNIYPISRGISAEDKILENIITIINLHEQELSKIKVGDE